MEILYNDNQKQEIFAGLNYQSCRDYKEVSRFIATLRMEGKKVISIHTMPEIDLDIDTKYYKGRYTEGFLDGLYNHARNERMMVACEDGNLYTTFRNQMVRLPFGMYNTMDSKSRLHLVFKWEKKKFF